MTGADGGLVIPLPEPVGRRARFGPFRSGQEAAKFAAYAGIGAIVAGATSPLLWLPFLGVGFVASVGQRDGKGFDQQLAGYLRFRFRTLRRPPGPGPAPAPPGAAGGIVRGPQGGPIAVIETGGVPVAFLPRRDAEALFASYRAMLGAQSGLLILEAGSQPVPVAPILPPPAEWPAGESVARLGYVEMLTLLTRHRRRRIVRIGIPPDRRGAGELSRLEQRVEGLFGHLLALGLAPVRLRGAALVRATGPTRRYGGA